MKKEDFILLISKLSKEEINEFIRNNGKERKPINPLIYPLVEQINKNEK